MGELVPGKDGNEFIEPDEVLKDKFDGMAIIESIRFRVFWNLAINGYVFELKDFRQPSEEALTSAFTDEDEMAEKIFEIARDNIIPENSDRNINHIYNLIQSEINKK